MIQGNGLRLDVSADDALTVKKDHGLSNTGGVESGVALVQTASAASKFVVIIDATGRVRAGLVRHSPLHEETVEIPAQTSLGQHVDTLSISEGFV